MKLSDYVREFVADPFDPNGDGHTSALELFLIIGLVSIMLVAWKRILNIILET